VLRSAWRSRRRWSPWAAAGLLLTLALLPGPGFLRYALLLVPAVLAAGLPDLARSTRYPRAVMAVLLFALVAGTAGAAYVTSGLDPRAGNDVPGHVDWAQAADHVHSMAPSLAYAPATTSLAYYLSERHGWTVSDNVQGPGRLELVGPDGQALALLEVARPEQLATLPAGALAVVPLSWLEDEGLDGFAPCGTVDGARLVVRGDVCPAGAVT
jgi:hypothetical protein